MTTTEEFFGLHRKNDHQSSVDGARVASRQAKTLKLRMLVVWGQAGSTGLNDEQAALRAGIAHTSCPWKRAGELRELGLITWHEGDMRRKATSGVHRKVSVITELGRQELRRRGLG